MQTARRVLLFSAMIGLASCDTGHVGIPVTVTVPADIPAIASGVLRLSLLVYDPLLADAPATLGDADSVRFAHETGTSNTFRMHVAADIPGGQKYYITVRGFELSPACERYVLWDGFQGTTVSLRVVMRPVTTPTCVPQALTR